MPLRFRRRSSADRVADGRWIVVGLGNPGERYARTRHNAGYMVISVLLERTRARLKTHKSGCVVAETRLAGQSVVLGRPTSFMNESGIGVRALVRFYKVPTARLIIVHDELDLPFGSVRIKFGGGTAGHNGLASVGSHLGTKDFVRVRVGVSRPRGRQDPADYVLTEFSAAERAELPHVLESAADAVESIVEVGVERAMNEVNTRER
ncbi:MAG: aminoacyl-tRNA hydrolase [Actinomycetota bacterium]